jgi:hypothetical protein
MVKGLRRSLARGAAVAQEVIKATYTVRALPIVVDGATGVGWGTAVLGDLPEGNILLLGAVSYMQFDSAGGQAGLSDTWNGDYGIGTTPASDGTITAGDIDVIGSTAATVAASEDSPRTRGVSVTATNGAVLDNTDGSLELNLNLLIDDADISADDVALTATGELHIAYIVLGDD